MNRTPPIWPACWFPAQGRDVSGNLDAGATPYVPVNTSGLSVSLPSGLALGAGGVSGSGWQTSGTLNPGDAVGMTFATEMPATSGKADPFFYTVVFAAVSNVDVPVSIAPQVGANPNVELPAEAPASAPAYVSGTLGDPSDPAAQGLNFSVAASDADAAGLSVSASSSDEGVAKVSLSDSGARRTLKMYASESGQEHGDRDRR